MSMNSAARKFALTTHITLSVGWLGAVVAYLALAVVGLTSDDAQKSRAAYLSMEMIGWFVIVPFSLATLAAGLVESLGTPWGLFRHWWIVVKFALTTIATFILLRHMQSVVRMSELAAETVLSTADFRTERVQLVVHAVGGLLVLLTATVLSVYKPWGLTPYGRRVVRSSRRVESAERTVREAGVVAVRSIEQGELRRAPRWGVIIAVHAVGLALLFLIAHLSGGMPAH